MPMPHRPWCSCVEKPHDDAAIKNPTGVNQWGFNLVVEYSTATNTHPEGVRLAVLKTAPEEEFGGYRRICANVLAG